VAAPAGGQAGSKPDWHEDTSAQLSQIQWRPHRYFTRSASTEIVGAAAPAGGPAGSKDTSAQLSKIEWRSASTQQLQKKDRATAAAASEKGSSVSPRSTHGYFTRSTSAEMVASLDEFLRIL
jgi:hypothetical protein